VQEKKAEDEKEATIIAGILRNPWSCPVYYTITTTFSPLLRLADFTVAIASIGSGFLHGDRPVGGS
jgi:hypothetical protein